MSTPHTYNPKTMLAALMVPLFMALMSVSVVNVALTPITGSLAATSSQTQWVVSGYALAFAIPLVAAGRIGDATGRRRIFILGLILFTLGSLLSGLAPNPQLLVAARVLQGVGAGLINPQTTGIIQANFQGQARARAYGMFGTVVALAVIVGPLLGGVLINTLGDNLGWRMMFLMNVPIGLAGIVAARRWIPRDVPVRSSTGARLDLDPLGMVMLALALCALLLPFVQRTTSLLTWALAPLGVALFLLFAAWEVRYKRAGRPPMLDMDFLREPSFRNGIMIVTLYFLGNTSVWLILPVYLQSHLGQSALVAGLVGIPAALVSAVAAPWAGRRVLGAGRRMVVAGYGMSMLSITATMLLVTPVERGHLPIWVLALSLIPMGAGGGLVISPNQTLTLRAVPPHISGVAGGVLSLGQRMGTAVGTALIPSLLYGLTDAGYHWNLGLVASFAAVLTTLTLGLTFTLADLKRERQEPAPIG